MAMLVASVLVAWAPSDPTPQYTAAELQSALDRQGGAELGLKIRLIKDALDVESVDQGCVTPCPHKALVASAELKARGENCWTNVLLDGFRINGSAEVRRGLQLTVHVEDKVSHVWTTITSVALLPEAAPQAPFVQEFCLPQDWLSGAGVEGLVFTPMALGDCSLSPDAIRCAPRSGLRRGAGIGALMSETRRSKDRAPRLMPWESRSYLRASIASLPTGATLILDGQSIGIRTDGEIELSQAALRRLRIRLASGEVPLATCRLEDASEPNVDVDVRCPASAFPRTPR